MPPKKGTRRSHRGDVTEAGRKERSSYRARDTATKREEIREGELSRYRPQSILTQSTDAKLNWLLVITGAILMGEAKIMSELDDLTTQVTNTKAGIDSAVVLLDGLAAKLDAAIASGNPAALVALSAELKDKTDALAAAVVADAR